MMQQIYRRPPCRSAFQYSCVATLLKQLFCVVVSCRFAYFNSFYSDHLGQLLFAVIKNTLENCFSLLLRTPCKAALRDSWKYTSTRVPLYSFVFVPKIKFQSIFVQVNNEHIIQALRTLFYIEGVTFFKKGQLQGGLRQLNLELNPR